MMNGEAVQKLISLFKPSHEIKDVEVGQMKVPFHVNEERAEQIKFNTPACLKVFSLMQFANAMPSLLVNQRLGETSKVLVNVISYDRVEAVVSDEDINGDRKEFMCADFSKMFEKFQQGQFKDQEFFIIELLSKFQDTPVRAELLKLVSSVKSGETTTSSDDGVSQVVEVKSGVALVKEATLKNVWKLQPFKTFPEVEQPEVNYILRVEGGRDKPRFALFEADGGLWKIKATSNVREWLENALKVKTEKAFEFIQVL